jgi:hypothetical protein
VRGEVPFIGRLPALLFASAVALAALSGAGAPTAAAGTDPSGPPLETPAKELEAALRCPERFEKSGEPVLLVHGTWANADVNWGWGYVPALDRLGLDVCLVDLPGYSTGDIQVTAEYVVHAVREIHARSGEKVDVVGHSQGGLQPRWAVKWWPDVQAAVDDYVGLASPNHGTVWADVPASSSGCMPSCMQMATTSDFIAALNDGDETPGSISYTNLYSLTDELVQPAAPEATSALAGGTNVLMQEVCPGRPVEHLQFADDGAVFDIVVDALTHPGTFDLDRFDLATSCAKASYEGGNVADLPAHGDDYEFPVAETFQGGDEPPLKGYARATGTGGERPARHRPGSGDSSSEVKGATEGGTGGSGPLPAGRPTPATGAPMTLLAGGGTALLTLALLTRSRLPRRG